MGVLVVRNSRQALDGSACRPQLRLENQPVRLVDLAGLERLARSTELGSRGDNGGPRDRAAIDLGDTGSCQRSQLRGAEARARRHDLVAGVEVTAARTDICTQQRGVRK